MGRATTTAPTTPSTTTTTADPYAVAAPLRARVLTALDQVRNCEDSPPCAVTALDAYRVVAIQVAGAYPSSPLATSAKDLSTSVDLWKGFGCPATPPADTGCSDLLDAATLAATRFARQVVEGLHGK